MASRSEEPMTCREKVEAKITGAAPKTIQRFPAWTCQSACFYIFASLILFAGLLAQSVQSNIAVKFMSLEKEAGCEFIPTSVSSRYGLDTMGNWDTTTKFSIVKKLYEATLLGFESSVDMYRTQYAKGIREQVGAWNRLYAKRTISSNMLSVLTQTNNVTNSSFALSVNSDVGRIFAQDSTTGGLMYVYVGAQSTSRRRLQERTIPSARRFSSHGKLTEEQEVLEQMRARVINRLHNSNGASNVHSRHLQTEEEATTTDTTTDTSTTDASLDEYAPSDDPFFSGTTDCKAYDQVSSLDQYFYQDADTTVSDVSTTFTVSNGTDALYGMYKSNLFGGVSSKQKSDNEVDLQVDMRAFVVAAAINQKVIGLQNLTFIKPFPSNKKLGLYFLNRPAYQGMDPVICNATSNVCNIGMGAGTAFPVLSHANEAPDDNGPGNCTCPTAGSNKKPGATCNYFLFYSMLMFYPGGSCFINERNATAYNAWDVAARHSYSILYLGTANIDNFMVSDNYYELPWLNCGGNFALQYNTKDQVNYANSPPTPLIQDYYRCRYTAQQIVTNSFSNAFANTQALLGALVTLMAILIPLFLKWKYGIFNKYNDGDIEETLREMAINKLQTDEVIQQSDRSVVNPANIAYA